MTLSRIAITIPIAVAALLLGGCGGAVPTAPPPTAPVTTTTTTTTTTTAVTDHVDTPPQIVSGTTSPDIPAPESPASEEQSPPTSPVIPGGHDDGPIIGWTDSAGHWISADTAIRALAAGIQRGAKVPDYLRCGTTCGELPTSGEVQRARACKDGTLPAQDCAGIDVDGILAAADGS